MSAGGGKRALASAARRGLKRFAGAADAVLPTSGLVVLAYHRVGGEGTSQMDLPLDRFRDQMARLADTARVLSLDQALDEFAAERTGSDPAVALTPVEQAQRRNAKVAQDRADRAIRKTTTGSKPQPSSGKKPKGKK